MVASYKYDTEFSSGGSGTVRTVIRLLYTVISTFSDGRTPVTRYAVKFPQRTISSLSNEFLVNVVASEWNKRNKL